MTDAEFILSVLEDGAAHSQADLLRRSFAERGCGLTVHSRVADLRRKGHFVACERVRGASRGEAWRYTLLGSLPEPSLSVSSLGLAHEVHSTVDGREGSGSQPELFTYPRSPEWA